MVRVVVDLSRLRSVTPRICHASHQSRLGCVTPPICQLTPRIGHASDLSCFGSVTPRICHASHQSRLGSVTPPICHASDLSRLGSVTPPICHSKTRTLEHAVRTMLARAEAGGGLGYGVGDRAPDSSVQRPSAATRALTDSSSATTELRRGQRLSSSHRFKGWQPLRRMLDSRHLPSL